MHNLKINNNNKTAILIKNCSDDNLKLNHKDKKENIDVKLKENIKKNKFK